MPSRSGTASRSSQSGALRPETIEHYLETIYYIAFEEPRVRPSRVAEWLGVSPPTVTVTAQRLQRDGWVTLSPDHGIELTERGLARAEEIVRSHRILERWLTDTLGLDWAAADAEAQLLVPGASKRVIDRIDELLGHPTTCPHGNVIPGRRPAYGKLVQLARLKPGAKARIQRISEVAEHDAPQLLRQLEAYGLVTGARVSIGETDPSMEAFPVVVGKTTRPIGTSVAELIWVEPE
jgi:DtxR family transcriptional regulator, iron-dependent repressor